MMHASPHCLRWPFTFLALLILLAAHAMAEPLTFRRAVELAVARAPLSDVEVAEQARAEAAYEEARRAYLPHLTVGSGLGATYGYPLTIEGGAPSIFNVNYQSMVYNPQQRALVRAAKESVEAQRWTTENSRRDVTLETSITYMQMNSLQKSLAVLNEQAQIASQLVQVTGARVEEGVEAQVELTRARLVEARTRMAIADASGALSVLRLRLAQLTGLAAETIEIVPDSIPAIPTPDANQNLVSLALENSATVRAAQQQARAEELRAEGAEKAAKYPSVDLAAQYGLFSRINNYDEFFQRFQRNNATIGLAIRLPILAPTQQAAADGARAQAAKAREQLERVRNQVSTETLQLARSAEQLAIAEQVADLEHQLAQSNANATRERIEAEAPPSPGARPPSPRDLQLAQIEASQRGVSAVDAGFQLQKARIELLRAIGRLEKWALGN